MQPLFSLLSFISFVAESRIDKDIQKNCMCYAAECITSPLQQTSDVTLSHPEPLPTNKQTYWKTLTVTVYITTSL